MAVAAPPPSHRHRIAIHPGPLAALLLFLVHGPIVAAVGGSSCTGSSSVAVPPPGGVQRNTTVGQMSLQEPCVHPNSRSSMPSVG